ncbi:MAG: Gx transporter family protein [Clostridia bacterium]|nr:Gx transporter family protein [Clostridia bacterium]
MESAGEKSLKKVARLGLLTALAMALSYIESFIPVNSAVPGGKLGLANIVTIYVLLNYGFSYAVSISVIRAILSGLLFGGIMSIPYSFMGAVASVIVMTLAYKIKGIGITGIAILGAFTHNLAQVAVACVIMGNILIMNYIWYLGIISIFAGTFTGVVSIFLNNTQRK